MIGFPFNPAGVRLVLVVVLIAAAIGILYAVREDGRKDALDAVDRANRQSESRANKAERDVWTCPPELWSREHQRCATKLH